MLAFITTEEYKELIEAKKERDMFLDTSIAWENDCIKAQTELEELLLMITKGEVKPRLGNDKFQCFDIELETHIADYINTHYVKDGRLQFGKVKENDDETAS